MRGRTFKSRRLRYQSLILTFYFVAYFFGLRVFFDFDHFKYLHIIFGLVYICHLLSTRYKLERLAKSAEEANWFLSPSCYYDLRYNVGALPESIDTPITCPECGKPTTVQAMRAFWKPPFLGS